MNTTHTPQGQRLDGFNLQAVLDAGTNGADKGRQQFFTPPDVARALTAMLPRSRACFVDLAMGAGSLLLGANAAENIGVDIDPRCARKPDNAPGRWHTATADLTSLYPLLEEVNWQFDLCGLNPPFSVRWHKDRLTALSKSDCAAVARTFQRAGGDTIDSTLAMFLIALDRMTRAGEGYLICNESTAKRFFGDPDDPAPGGGDVPRAHVWLWLTVPPGLFEGVRDFNTAVLYFARSHQGTDPIHVTARAATADAILDAFSDKSVRYSYRTGTHLYSEQDFHPSTVPAFTAAAREFDARQQADRPQEFNLWLERGTIRRHLTPFQSFSGRIPKDAVKALDAIQGKTPMALVVAKETRVQLLRAVRSECWRVDPALVAAVENAVRQYNANRAPFYPLNDVQRLGFLDEEDSILCKKSGSGFVAGRRYPISCSTEHVSREHKRPNIQGEMETVTLSGQEMAIVITDDHAKRQVTAMTSGWTGYDDGDFDAEAGNYREVHHFATEQLARSWQGGHTTGNQTVHIFRVQDADKDGAQADKRLGRVHHSVAELVELFEIPDVPDVSVVHADRYAANVARIHEIERTLGEFTAREFQVGDVARACVHDGGVISWEPGMGKTIATFLIPQVKGALRTLIVAPEQLHQQIIDEGQTKFGVKVRPLESQEGFENDADLRQVMLDRLNGRDSDVRGWWITSYTTLGFNGGDEWEGKENDEGEMILTDRIKSLRHLHPNFKEGCDDNVGKVKDGIKCLWRPSLATLVADLFDCVECDEAVRLKSNNSYTSLGVRKMRPAFRYVMTATPIKNHLDDIFWLAWWSAGGTAEANIRWPYAGTNEAKEEFANTFMVMEQNHTKEAKNEARTGKYRKIVRRLPQICNLHHLWKLLSGVTIRRRKDNCGEDIVPKVFIPLTVKPGKAQLEAYRFHLANAPEFNRDGQPMNPIARIVTQLTNLRQAALCPDTDGLNTSRISLKRMRDYLFALKDPKVNKSGISPGQPFNAVQSRKAVLVAHKGERTPFEAEATVAFEIVERMITQGGIDLDAIWQAAPKLAAKLQGMVDIEGKEPRARSHTDHNPKQAAILQLIHDLLAKGEQSMVLTPFTHFNQCLYRRLVSAGVSVCLLDGNVSPAKRGQMAKAFKRKKYAVLIGGEQSMGEGGSFENCSYLIRPSLGWALDVNRQCEDRPHRLTSPKAVTIYEFAMENSIDQRILSIYHEKADSAMLALDGSLFADKTAEINLGELLKDAIRNFDPNAATVDEQDIEHEWNTSLKARLTQAERTFRQFHPAIVPDMEGNRVTPAEVRAAMRDAGIAPAPAKSKPKATPEAPCLGIVRCIPAATFAILIESRDPAAIEQVRTEFVAFCNDGQAKDWRKAWAEFDRQRKASKRVTRDAKPPPRQRRLTKPANSSKDCET